MEEGVRRPLRALLLFTLIAVSGAGFAGCLDSEQGARLAADAVGCTDASGAQNEPRRFQYGGAASCKTGTETFAWENPSPYADVQYGSGVVEGTLTIEILDAADRTVYEGSVAASGEAEGRQERTEAGLPGVSPAGTWTIELTFENVTGALGIQVFSGT